MIEIPLANGRGAALIDDGDLALVDGRRWSMASGYARHSELVNGKWVVVFMHRLITGASPDQHVDHANRNRLDNRRANLRFATRSQNGANRKVSRNNTSGYVGVGRRRDSGKWQARLCVEGTRLHLGIFHDVADAARAYDAAALEHFGEFAALNFPESVR